MLAGTALACQAVLGLDEPKQGTLPEAGPVIDPCAHARPPPPPDAASPHPGPEENYWMVMTGITFPLVDDAGAPRGYDLDEACTCAADLHDGAAPCNTLAGERACDGDGGIDNGLATTLSGYSQLIDLAAAGDKVNDIARQGVVLYLSNYNGEEDDPEVGVTLVPTSGLFSLLGCDGQPRPDAEAPSLEEGFERPVTAAHDGCDHWKIPDEKLKTVGGVPIPIGGSVTTTAYVSGFTLVAKSSSTLLTINGRGLTANDGYITGHLEPVTVAGRRVFRITDGVGAARSPMNNFVDLLAHTHINVASGQGQTEICKTGLWTGIKQSLCGALDTMSSKNGDFQGQSCNAFSVAWGYAAEPIYLDDAGHNLRPDPDEIDCGVIATPEQLCGVTP